MKWFVRFCQIIGIPKSTEDRLPYNQLFRFRTHEKLILANNTAKIFVISYFYHLINFLLLQFRNELATYTAKTGNRVNTTTFLCPRNFYNVHVKSSKLKTRVLSCQSLVQLTVYTCRPAFYKLLQLKP